MPDLDALATFADQRRHNLTGPLRHEQVVALAEAWLPEVFFHERERFHPVDLPGMLELGSSEFERLPEGSRDAFRIPMTRDAGGQSLTELFDPPVIHVPEGGGRRVLASGADAAEALDDPELGRNGVFTYGARIEAGRAFFGAGETVAGLGEPSPGDPRRPRHLPMVVRAELRMLLETLKHELQLDERTDAEREAGVPDAVWAGFAVEESFFAEDRGEGDPERFPRRQKRAVLAALVAAQEIADAAARAEAEAEALAQIPRGHRFVSRAWDAVKGYAFLEFYLIYPYNDYKEYGDWPFVNEHEGDVEGCCVVFERHLLERLAAGTLPIDDDDLVPHTVITSVHEEFNDSDRMKRLSPVRQTARSGLKVYVAAGSHATYLEPGDHDVLDFEDVVTDLPLQAPTAVIVLGALSPGGLLAFVLLAGVVEHFVDSEDRTSEDGVSIGPGEADPGPGSLRFDQRIEVTPLSDVRDPQEDQSLYQAPQRGALAVRVFPGRWGGHDGLIDHSSPWENKTARYFRRFLQGDIEPVPVVD